VAVNPGHSHRYKSPSRASLYDKAKGQLTPQFFRLPVRDAEMESLPRKIEHIIEPQPVVRSGSKAQESIGHTNLDTSIRFCCGSLRFQHVVTVSIPRCGCTGSRLRNRDVGSEVIQQQKRIEVVRFRVPILLLSLTPAPSTTVGAR